MYYTTVQAKPVKLIAPPLTAVAPANAGVLPFVVNAYTVAFEIPEITILASLFAAEPAALQLAWVTTGVPTVGVVQVGLQIFGFKVTVASE